MKVSELMTSDPACCLPESSLQDAALLMVEKNCGAIPVVESSDSSRPVGMITDRDITINTVALGKDPAKVTVGEVMTFPAITVEQDADVEDCYKQMEQHQIRRMIVVDSDDNCRGIVAQADIARKAPEAETAELVRDISMPPAAAAA